MKIQHPVSSSISNTAEGHLCPLVAVVERRSRDRNEGREGNAHLSSHALLHESAQLALIVNLDQLLRPVGRIRDIELHLDVVGAVKIEGGKERRKGGGLGGG